METAIPWWVDRWLTLLHSYRYRKRLERARLYAQGGNLLAIEIQAGQIRARVQGTQAEPYRVTLALDPFDDEAWAHVAETLRTKARWLALLLAGQMPEDIETVFTANGLSLFPFQLQEVRSHCSCPDPVNPCKHVGAVYFQLAESLALDPFMLFALRGRSREALLAMLWPEPAPPSMSGEVFPPSLALDAAGYPSDRFWHYPETSPSFPVGGEGNPLRSLGPLPLPPETAQRMQLLFHQLYGQVGAEVAGDLKPFPPEMHPASE